MRIGLSLVAVALGTLAAFTGGAGERQAYKYVDEKGNVVYSQTPPVKGADVKKVDISPAHRGGGGDTYGRDIYRYQQPYPQPYPNAGGDARYRSIQEYQKQKDEAERKRLEALQAECNRNRGADCSNPETLRQMESQRIPGGRNYKIVR